MTGSDSADDSADNLKLVPTPLPLTAHVDLVVLPFDN